MTNTVGTSGVSREDLALHFDGELTGAEAHELAAQIEADPELQSELQQLGIMRGLVSETLMAKAEQVPQARFEQIWDEIDRTIEQESRQAEGAHPHHTSIWTRLWAALKPARLPLVAAAAAAVVTLTVVKVGGDGDEGPGGPEGPNNPGAVASSQETPAEPSTPEPSALEPTAPQPDASDRIAQAPEAPPPAMDDMPKPKKVEAEIHGVEFSGRSGLISKTGTVTVLYLEEEADPKDSERSL